MLKASKTSRKKNLYNPRVTKILQSIGFEPATSISESHALQVHKRRIIIVKIKTQTKQQNMLINCQSKTAKVSPNAK